jgi:uncharacterized protein DUF2800
MGECVEITGKGEIVARVTLNPRDLQTDDLGSVIAKLKAIEDWIDEAKGELRTRLLAGEECDTWHLETVNGRRRVCDVPAAWKRLRDAGVPELEILESVELPIGKIEAAFVKFAAENEGAGKAEAEAQFGHVMGDSVRRDKPTKQVKRSL